MVWFEDVDFHLKNLAFLDPTILKFHNRNDFNIGLNIFLIYFKGSRNGGSIPETNLEALARNGGSIPETNQEALDLVPPGLIPVATFPNFATPRTNHRHMIYITTVNSWCLLSTLLIQFKSVYRPFGQSRALQCPVWTSWTPDFRI